MKKKKHTITIDHRSRVLALLIVASSNYTTDPICLFDDLFDSLVSFFSNSDTNKTRLFPSLIQAIVQVSVTKCNRSLTASFTSCSIREIRSSPAYDRDFAAGGKLVSRIFHGARVLSRPTVSPRGLFSTFDGEVLGLRESIVWFEERRARSECSHRSQSPKCLHHRDGIRLLSAASARLVSNLSGKALE